MYSLWLKACRSGSGLRGLVVYLKARGSSEHGTYVLS